MQTTGYVEVNGQKILALVRLSSRKADHVTMKIRQSGKDGTHFSDEEKFLAEEPERLEALLSGKVIRC